MNVITILKRGAAVLTAGVLAVGIGASTASAATVHHPNLAPGSHGPAVTALQKELNAKGFWVGTPDGQYGDVTRQGVMALQKITGIARDGGAGPITWAKLDHVTRPAARTSRGTGVYVDKKTQTLRLEANHKVRWVINASTGSGKAYSYTYKGKTVHTTAVTPNMDQVVFRRVNGMDNGPLGSGIWRPMYFKGGIAIHGYTFVPAYADSHGCVRISYPAMNLLWTKAGGVNVGTEVRVG